MKTMEDRKKKLTKKFKNGNDKNKKTKRKETKKLKNKNIKRHKKYFF